MKGIEIKSLKTPDETRKLPKTQIDVVTLEHATVMRAVFQPGWKWSECVKPTVGTNTCQVAHLNYIISGRMRIIMDDGTEKEMASGDVAAISPGHDAWVIGDEPCVAIDFLGGVIYGKK